MSEWRVEDTETVEIDEDVSGARIRLVAGAVDVVSTDGPARVEVEVLDGPPVVVRFEHGVLRVGYDDVKWGGILAFVTGSNKREARVSIAVPDHTKVQLGVVSATATVAGFAEAAEVRSVSGTVVVDDLSAGTRGETVSGDLQLRGVRGPVKLFSVSGDLTVVDGRPSRLKAETVSGAITLDLLPEPASEITLSTVSGDLLLRAPVEALGRVRFDSTSGRIDSDNFPVEIHRSPGSSKARATGGGDVDVTGSTVSGRIVLVDRPTVTT
ncbi:DUF4097 family beta strand repeat-containing protein [Jatrophihabitans sp. YIM 134969]